MYTARKELADEIGKIRDAGLYKEERVLVTPQGPEVQVAAGTTGVLLKGRVPAAR